MLRNRLSLVVAAVLVLATVGGGAVVATTDTAPDEDTAQQSTNTTILVSASGSVSSAPDKAVLRLAVEATAANASVGRERVAENVSTMRAALREMGLNESQIRTSDYDLYKDERRVRSQREEAANSYVYRARHQFAIELDDVDRAGSVIDTAIANGATSLNDIDFTLSADTRRSLREQALEQAMANARSEADTLANSANVTVSGVNDITTVERRGGGIPRPTEAAYADTGASTSIDAGPVTVSVSVDVEYEAVPSQ